MQNQEAYSCKNPVTKAAVKQEALVFQVMKVVATTEGILNAVLKIRSAGGGVVTPMLMKNRVCRGSESKGQPVLLFHTFLFHV